ncbi:hypothetical protein DPMN_069232, partial [Dreissena polymorpha]
CAVCIGAIILSTLSTIDTFETTMTQVVIYMEPILLVWLTVEYVTRIWASGCRSRYQGLNGRLKFAQRPLCIIDGIIIVSTVMVILVGSSSEMFAASTLRGLRFFQILRLVRMDRRAGTWKLLGSVVWAHRREDNGSVRPKTNHVTWTKADLKHQKRALLKLTQQDMASKYEETNMDRERRVVMEARARATTAARPARIHRSYRDETPEKLEILWTTKFPKHCRSK